MPSAEIQHFYDPATNTLTYVVFDPASADAVVIDPVLDFDQAAGRVSTGSADALARFVAGKALRVHWILETHAHADHLTAADVLRRRFDAKVAIGQRITEVQATFAALFDLPPDVRRDGSQFDRLLSDGETLDAGTLRFKVITTPGHTPACVSYVVGDAVFTGDALFVEDLGTGRCDFPAGSPGALYDSVQKLYALADETRVFVGHDYPPGGRTLKFETTIGAEKAGNAHVKATTTREEYVAFRSGRDRTLGAPRLLWPSLQVNIRAGRLPEPRANGRRYLVLPLAGEVGA